MLELSEPRQAEKAACAFERVHQSKDGVEHLGIVRILLEAHELDVELVKVLAGLGQEFARELVHTPPPARAKLARAPSSPEPFAASARIPGWQRGFLSQTALNSTSPSWTSAVTFMPEAAATRLA